ncbi:adhesion G protein-coupled receptor G3-like isoform X1 [Arapaima gigas]
MEQLLWLLLLGFITSSSSTQCHTVLGSCLVHQQLTWTRCFEQQVMTCDNRVRKQMNGGGNILDASIEDVNMINEVRKNTSASHLIHIPAGVLKRAVLRSRSLLVRVAVIVFNASLFQVQNQTTRRVLGNAVVQVKVGTSDLHNLSEPVNLTFTRDGKERNGSCVFWKESSGGQDTGDRWSTEGCQTVRTSKNFLCSCDHLSFFAVLVNPRAPDTISNTNVRSLSYLTYMGCGVSAVCTCIALLMHLCMRLSGKKSRDEHSMAVHLQLMVALFLLHVLFLLNAWQAERPLAAPSGSFCLALALLLHWALLATFTWMALEAFHLYLLLVRVFNIYVRRYLLKLCMVGWGVPTIVVASCALTKPYGLLSFRAENRTDNMTNSTITSTSICWITNGAVQHVTVTAYLSLTFLLSAVMFSVVLVKLKQIGGKGTQTPQKKIGQKCVTLLGLTCVLGVPWGLAFLTYGPLSLPSLYVFTIVNSLQGVFLFLWFCSLTLKSHVADKSTVTYQSTRKTDSSSAAERHGCLAEGHK